MKKILPIFLLFFFLSAKSVFALEKLPTGYTLGARGPWFVPSIVDYAQNVYKQPAQSGADIPITAERYGNFSIGNVAAGIACFEVNCGDAANYTYAADASSFFAANIDTMMRTPPASSRDYIAYMGGKLRIPGTPAPAYAAGPGRGFNELAPILPIWTVMRNLAYLVFAIIFIVVGLMIMFRVKIDPKTAANLQNSLPKIIFALVMVTFSYAIAGFLIDIMYVLLSLILAIARAVATPNGVNLPNIATSILNGSIWSLIFKGDFLNLAKTSAFSAIRSIVASILGDPGAVSVQNVLTAQNIAAIPVGVFAFLLIATALLVAVFRTWLALLGAYAQIILAIIFSPVWLMFDAIPGQNQFGKWSRGLLANLMAFPTVFAMIMIAEWIIAMGAANVNQTGFVPPLIGGSNFAGMASLVGLGIILTIPATVKIVQEALKAPAFKYGNEWLSSGTAGFAGGVAAARYAPNAPGIRQVGGWLRDRISPDVARRAGEAGANIPGGERPQQRNR